jgi:hypothetical protein
MMLGVVFWAIQEAADPETWAWLWRTGDRAESAQEEAGQAQPALAAEQPDEQPDEQAAAEQPIAEAEGSGRFFPGVQPEYLEAVDDDQPIWKDENPAWFNLLGVLKSHDAETLERASSGPVSYVQLMDQPREYRGELVTLRGTIRCVDKVGAGRNDHGIRTLYRLVVRPANSQNPVIVWCLELPEEFPIGRDIEQDARITGFFFKRWMYTSEDGMRTAPALLARTARWFRPPPIAQREPPSQASTVFIVIAASVVSVVVIVYAYVKTRRRRLPGPEQPVRLEELEKLELPSEPRFAGNRPSQSTEQSGAG